MLDSLKQMVIRTPLERPLTRLRYLAGIRHRLKHPEQSELFIEDRRIELMLGRLLREDSNCIDVGCHLGSFLSMLLRLAPRGRHMAFEALPDKAARLARKFTDVQIVQSAVGDRRAEIPFFDDLTHPGYSSMNKPVMKGDVTRTLTVGCDTLDNLMPANRAVDFMKVDVEGAELLVFKGAERFIARCRPVILFECATSGLESAGIRGSEIYQFIRDGLGYDVWLIKDWLANRTPLGLDPFREAMAYPAQARNFVAVPPGRRCETRAGV